MSEKKNVRKRVTISRSDPWNWTLVPKPLSAPGSGAGVKVLSGTQVTESEGHPWNRNSRFKGRDIGGAFRTEKIYFQDDRVDPIESPLYSFSGKRDVRTATSFGPIYAVAPGDGTLPDPIESSDDSLIALGTKAIALTKPTKAKADLLVDLGETFKDGLPHLLGAATLKERTAIHRGLSSEHLNVQFGWLPLVADVKASMELVKNLDAAIHQYKRDAGRLVRRRFDFPVERTTGDPVLVSSSIRPSIPGAQNSADFNYAIFSSYPTAGFPLWRQTNTYKRKWFTGAYTYYLPDWYNGTQMDNYRLAATKFLGLEVTPETIWNLAPWSWLTDWFANTGDIIGNASDYLEDGLLLRYGYMMEHSIVENVYTMPDVPLKRYGRTTFTLRHVREVKKRVKATPFGFGLTYAGLSNKQKSILAAIGITRWL